MNRRTQFIPRERKIIVFGFGRTDQPPRDLLRRLVENGVLQGTNMRQHTLSQSLVLVLAEHDNLPPTNLLARLAEELSNIPRHRAVRSPWEVGGRAVNIRLAVDMIGDVFRANAIQAVRAG
ncbi:MAG TPA: hypothetical protein VJM46_00225 [Candidatus Saccharimonadales bacterium]|nr:hypothetical protein [Candidatus Saccharimonadales bacterium]